MVQRPQISINDILPEVEHLTKVSVDASVNTDLSPKKKTATVVQNLGELVDQNIPQKVSAVPTKVYVALYNSCPVLGCKKSVYKNEDTNYYTCDKCEKVICSCRDRYLC